MIPLSEAQHVVWSAMQRLNVVSLDHREAVGAVLAADVVATEDVPPFDNSAVDGYAVRAADVATTPVELDVVDVVAAGVASAKTLAAGQSMKIMTGAPIPAGADAVVMVEDRCSDSRSGKRRTPRRHRVSRRRRAERCIYRRACQHQRAQRTGVSPCTRGTALHW
jgi:molybdopterin biosynthesis enzyme